MASAYYEKKGRQKEKNQKKTPYLKILIRQAIAAFLCFFLIKFLSLNPAFPWLKEKIKTLTKTSVSAEIFNEKAREISDKFGAAVRFFKNGDKKYESQKDKKTYPIQ